MNILLMGPSRFGKTMISNMIASKLKGYSKISVDALKLSFKECFPDLGIGFNKEQVNVKQFPDFVEKFFDISTHKDNNNGMFYIIDGGGLPNEVALRFKNKPNTLVIFLGKSKISVQKHFKQIRKYENIYDYGGWTKRLDDNTLKNWCESWIKDSKENEQFCKDNGLLYVDTSINQTKVIKEVVKKLKNNEFYHNFANENKK